ncbi:MAG TPA: hypothetical protein DDW93_11565 [Firmicutes bacterium]|nr:hypothetical protein [Bacillota bacterium]HBK69038.1 hypothetical protein [Bacillota bacterium]HBT17466.1 hypothetical protein [Bacillota bacterium]
MASEGEVSSVGKILYPLFLLMLLFLNRGASEHVGKTVSHPAFYSYLIINNFLHDPEDFTQGLI